MLDVAIIGGGVCGLALAHSLQARHVDWQLFEARPRLGGRVLTERCAGAAPLDLGATWFWPGHQPSITRLVQDLGLSAFDQPDDGCVVHLSDPNKPAESISPGAEGVHGGARRVAGGMARLVEALARPLPAERMRCGAVLHSLHDRGDAVDLRWLDADGHAHTQRARRVVLALPPRVAEATLQFEPPLDRALTDALRATPTWMATAAKVAMRYDTPVWQARSATDNAWVTHPQAVLAEVFDASTPDQGHALAGFVALGVSGRQQFQRSLALLSRNQLGQLFGPAAEDGELHLHDWALEPTTCSPLDAAEDGARNEHPVYGDTRLAQPHWQGRLRFGGTETARQGGGYLEGALSAAARLRRALLDAPAPAVNPP